MRRKLNGFWAHALALSVLALVRTFRRPSTAYAEPRRVCCPLWDSVWSRVVAQMSGASRKPCKIVPSCFDQFSVNSADGVAEGRQRLPIARESVSI